MSSVDSSASGSGSPLKGVPHLIDRAKRLFAYLAERTKLRAKAVRDIRGERDYPEIIWLADLPSEPEVFSTHRLEAEKVPPDERDDAEQTGQVETVEDVPLISIERPQTPKAPSPPAETVEWIDGGQPTLERWNGDPPKLLDFILEFSSSGTGETSANHEKVPEKVLLREQPRVAKAWFEYVERKWKPWAKERARTEPVRIQYEQLFELRTQVERDGEDFELVVCAGLLSWVLQKETIYRHVATLPVRIDLDSKSGRISVLPANGTALTRLETEMLPGPRQPQLDGLTDIERSPMGDLMLLVSSPLAKAEVVNALRSWCHKLDANTVVNESDAKSKAPTYEDPPLLAFAPALILRKRPAISMTVAFEQCARQVETEGEIPFNIARVVDVLEDKATSDSASSSTQQRRTAISQPLLPLPYNEEQVRIVRRLASQRGVLVQGPPGTGKSHTIANLICHLLAEGKRILVTSAKARPLQVLHEKLPAELRPLCLTSLGGGREEAERLRAAVQGILDRHSTFDAEMSRREEQRLSRQLETLAAEHALLLNQRKERWELEARSDNSVAGGVYSGQAMAIAAQVAADAKAHEWFPDEIGRGDGFPLTPAELVQVETFIREVSPELRAECLLHLPPLDKLISTDDFRAAMGERSQLVSRSTAIRASIEGVQARLVAEQETRLKHFQVEIERARFAQQKAHGDFAVASSRAARERARLNALRRETEDEYGQKAEELKAAHEQALQAADLEHAAALKISKEFRGVPGAPGELGKLLNGLDSSSFEQLAKTTKAMNAVLTGKQTGFGLAWRSQAFQDSLAGRTDRWTAVYEMSLRKVATLPDTENLQSLSKLRIDLTALPSTHSQIQLLEDARDLLSHFESGGGAGIWFFRPDVVKRTRWVSKAAQINGRACNSKEQLRLLVLYLAAEEALSTVAKLWMDVGLPKSFLDVEGEPLEQTAARIRNDLLDPLSLILDSASQIRKLLPNVFIQNDQVEAVSRLFDTVRNVQRCREIVKRKRDELAKELLVLLTERDTKLADIERMFVPADSSEIDRTKAELEALERDFAEQRASISDEFERELSPLRKALEATIDRVAQLNSNLETSKAAIADATLKRAAHPLNRIAATALDTGDVPAYARVREHLSAIASTVPVFQSWVALVNKLHSCAPRLAEAIKEAPYEELWQVRLRSLSKAWAWAQARAWVRHFKRLVDGNLDQKLQRNEIETAKGLADKAANLAWRHCLEAATEEQKRALSRWQQAMKRVGQGKGKYADRHRRIATKEMRVAQGMIPALVTPLARLVESLPVRTKLFDVVIVDEASQLGPEGLLLFYLADKIVVVGDDQQISPEDVGIDQREIQALSRLYLKDIPQPEGLEQESVFNLANNLFSSGRIMLREHFRCMPEIIKFSNELCYRDESGKPQLVPLRKVSGKRLEPVLRTVHVENGYRNGDNNLPEMEALVHAIQRCAADPEYNGKTFGVITLLGDTQADFIQRALLHAVGSEEIERRHLICGNAYAFQGDERDVMFLSLVIANEDGHKPLTKEADKRRFNVAASRARDQMWLFHSVLLDDLKPDDLRYQLLHYYKTVPEDHAYSLEEQLKQCDSDFERMVAKRVVERGYRVFTQVKVAGYKIDLVLEGEGGKQLAIECDGDRWHGPEQFDADMKRQRILERCGWKFWRVWGSDFYDHPEAALVSLWRLLDAQGIARRAERSS